MFLELSLLGPPILLKETLFLVLLKLMLELFSMN